MLTGRVLGPARTPGDFLRDSPAHSSSRSPFDTHHRQESSSTSSGLSYRRDADELVWSGRKVAWSRGVQIVRQYSFDDEEEDVAYALFATFPAQSVVTTQSKDVDLGLSGTFGPFHASQSAKWGAPQAAASSSSSNPITDEVKQDAVIIFLQTTAHIYFPSGRDLRVHLPFIVERAWALPGGGIMVQRQLDRREMRELSRSKSMLEGINQHRRHSLLDDFAGGSGFSQGRSNQQPRLSVLMGPLEEFKAVVEGTVGVEGDGHRLLHSEDIGPDRSVISSSTESPFVLLHDRRTRQIIFTRRVVVPVEPVPDVAQPILTPRTMRPSDILMSEAPAPSAPPLTRPRPSLRRNASSFAGEHRSSGLADPLDRAQRRAPRLSRALETQTGPGELQRTLDPPVLPSTLNKGKMKARVAEEKRRESGASVVMREDLDAVGLGRTALHRADEWDMRETTMLMGLERDEVDRSEIVLDRIWAWSTPDGFDPSSTTGFVFDILSPSQLHIAIHSRATQQLFTFQAIHHIGDRWQITPQLTIPSLSAIPITSYRPEITDTLNLDLDGNLHIITAFGRFIPLKIALPAEGDDVARKLASSLHMTIEEDERMSSGRASTAIARLEEVCRGHFVAVSDSGKRYRCSADFSLPPGLARNSLEALGYALPNEVFFNLKTKVIQAAGESDEVDKWYSFADSLRGCFDILYEDTETSTIGVLAKAARQSSDALLARLAARRGNISTKLGNPTWSKTHLDPSHIPAVVMSLHLVGQECRLRLGARSDLKRVASLIRELCAAIVRRDWWDYWMRVSPSNTIPWRKSGSPPRKSKFRADHAEHDVDSSLLDKYEQPPDILEYLFARLTRVLKPFASPRSLGGASEFGDPQICPQTELLVELYGHMAGWGSSTAASSVAERAHAALQFMVDQQLGPHWLADLPPCLSLPILEMMKLCQMAPKREMSSLLYELIGRADLQFQLSEVAAEDQVRQEVCLSHGLADEKVVDARPSVGDLMRGDISSVAKLGLPHVRFGIDRRLHEIERMMQASRIRSIAIEVKGSSDAEIAHYQQAMVNTIAQRTLAVLIGQGIFEYGTRNKAITGTWEIPLIELSVKLSPTNTVLKAQIHGDHVDWPCFHNGVSSALTISADCSGIDSAWIVLNKPTPLNPEHGGFLLGLGLTGHLRKLKTYHAFPYMEARHDFTSVGLLLGLASSYAGSEDILITKTLSLHTHALLPMGSMALNAPPIVQCSALVGLGLVYAGSKNLRMAEVTLGEIGRAEMAGIDHFADYQEAYSFSAAAAFGLIMLGRGGQTASEVDRRMLGRLRRCIHGDGPELKMAVPIDSTVTGAGATLALALMYLKTNRADIRDILEIPMTAVALDSIRPDLLLLRTLARGLIMSDSVSPAMTWIDAQLPPFLRAQVTDHKRVGGLDLATDLAYINIIGGACLAIGLKFAGTASEMAHNNLMHFFHVLSRSAGSGIMSYEGKIRRSAARQALNVVTIAICCVMSGTGELQVLRRLRISHGQEGVGVTYGTHMAMHMAMGLLFLGRGQYTLGTNNLAIAAMSIAFFPRFMHTPDDNRAYPQAFRHLWALAVEPRCLMARDVDSGETVYLPIKVRLREGDTIRSQNLISPTLIAPFGNLVSIEVDSPRYWPITYDFSDPSHRAALVRTRTIHVKRRAGHQDYNSDPKGNRSIFIRAGGVTGFDLHYDLLSSASPPTIPAAEIIDLIRQHSPQGWHHELAVMMAGPSEYEKFIRTVLLECVTLDKPHVLLAYMGLMVGDRGAEGLRGVEMLRHYYHRVWDGSGSTPAERRITLLRPGFLAALAREVPEIQEESKRKYLREGVWSEGDAQALAQWLVADKVPPLPLLEALREKVSSTAMAGTGVDQGDIAVRIREVSRFYEASLSRVWDAEVSAGPMSSSSSGWKEESIREAIAAWLS